MVLNRKTRKYPMTGLKAFIATKLAAGGRSSNGK